MSVRKNTNKLLEMADKGLISWRTLTEMAFKWMSEDDVTAMAEANELFWEDGDDTDLFCDEEPDYYDDEES